MPSEWRTSIITLLYKDKSDIQDYNNYRGIKLFSHTIRLWERAIERRLMRDILVPKNQFDFMLGKSTSEAMYLIRRLMESYKDKKDDLHMMFINLRKAYDRVLREAL